MAERRGTIIVYNPTNRQGQIRPEDNGPAALFYVTSVSNPEPPPKAKDTVVFDAPAPRKNKRGKLIQDRANSVTIEERAPDPTPEELKALERKKQREEQKRLGKGRKGRDRKGRDRKGGDRRAGERRGGERNARPGQDRQPERRLKEGGRRGERTEVRKGKGARQNQKKTKRPPIHAKIRYPAAQDIPRTVLDMNQSNPSLVFDKFIQWPAPPAERSSTPQSVRASKKQNAAAQASETSKEQKTPAQPAEAPKEQAVAAQPAEAPKEQEVAAQPGEAPKEQEVAAQPGEAQSSWKLSGKHKQFFLSRTLAPLYRNYERRTLPWAAVRSRREAMLRSLEHSGYSIASEVLKGPWRFAFAQSLPSILDEAPLRFQRTFGYPIIPAERLQALIRRYIEKAPQAPQPVPAELLQALNEGPDAGSPAVLIFDAVPTNKIVQFTIERSYCCTPDWGADGSPAPADGLQGRRLHALCTGEDAAFSISIAAREPDGQRTVCRAVLELLAGVLRESNEAILAPGGKEEKKLPRGVLY